MMMTTTVDMRLLIIEGRDHPLESRLHVLARSESVGLGSKRDASFCKVSDVLSGPVGPLAELFCYMFHKEIIFVFTDSVSLNFYNYVQSTSMFESLVVSVQVHNCVWKTSWPDGLVTTKRNYQ